MKQGGRVSPVGINTAYGLDGPGSTVDRRRIFLFSIALKLILGPIQPPTEWVPLENSPGRCKADHPHLSSVEVKDDGAILPFHHTSSWHGA
jgi:hypothetical protein